jgi:hypothetical protein
MSISAKSNPGMLSARGPWEPENLQQFQPDYEGGGEATVAEEPPQPLEFLDNGEPKPVVTLIDFPQMVSTRHPNACDLYERDTACLFKFFTHKLQFQIPDSEISALFLSWDSVLKVLEEEQQQQQQQQISISDNDDDDDDDTQTAIDDSASVCLANKAQLRLDSTLQASGYSDMYAKKGGLELYYHNNQNINESKEEYEDQEENDKNLESIDADENDADDDSDDDEVSSIDSGDDDHHHDVRDNISTVQNTNASVSNISIISTNQLANMTQEQLEEHAKARVQLHLQKQSKKKRQQGAFRKRNSNKSYSKGRRVYNDVL